MASITVSSDRLHATLHLAAGEALAVAALRALLAASDIHHGVHRQTLVDATRPAAGARDLALAAGDPARAGTAAVRLDVRFATLPAEVATGAVIGRLSADAYGQPGTGVDGRSLPPALPALGAGLRLADDGQVETRWAGWLHADAECGVRVDLADGVRTRLVVRPVMAVAVGGGEAALDLAAGEHVEGEALGAALVAAGVVAGLDVTAAAAAAIPEPRPRRLTLAHAEAPDPGTPDIIEHLVNSVATVAAAGDERIDYHRQCCLVEVPIDSELARVRRGRPSRPGRTVTGVAVPVRTAHPAVDLAPLVGPGSRLREGEPPTLVAAIAGAYGRNPRGVVSVCCPVVIEGNLDHACGDVDTRLPVIVRGDILAGFALVCGDSATVAGAVEDARIQIEGDLAVGSGLLPGVQRVTVHGRLTARHIMSRSVKAAVVAVTNAIVDSRIIAGESVICTALVNSRVIAGHEVVCDVIGDAAGSLVTVVLGGEPFLAALAGEATADQPRLRAEAAHLDERLAFLRHHLHATIAREGVEAAGDLAGELRECESRAGVVASALERNQRVLARYVTASAHAAASLEVARLRVRRRVHANVEIVIGDHGRLLIDQEMGASVFRLIDGRLARE